MCKVNHVAIYIVNKFIDYMGGLPTDNAEHEKSLIYSKTQRLVCMSQIMCIKEFGGALVPESMTKTESGFIYPEITELFLNEECKYEILGKEGEKHSLGDIIKKGKKVKKRLDILNYEQEIIDKIFTKYAHESPSDME